MTLDSLEKGSEVVLVVHGSLDRRDAAELQAAVRQLPSAAHVTVDLHDIRVWDFAALATLAGELTRLVAPHVALVGLSDHHLKLLGYMGVRPAMP